MPSERGPHSPISYPRRSTPAWPWGHTQPSPPTACRDETVWGVRVSPGAAQPEASRGSAGRQGAHHVREMPRASMTPPPFHSGTNWASRRLSGACPAVSETAGYSKTPTPGLVFLSPSPLSWTWVLPVGVPGRQWGGGGGDLRAVITGALLRATGSGGEGAPSPESPSAFSRPLLDLALPKALI